MATKTAKIERLDDSNIIVITWLALSDGDDGEPVRIANYPDRTAQAIGDATSVAIQGSNDGTNWAALNDPDGSAIALAGATYDVALIRENTLELRPVATGGSDTDVIIVAVTER